jgi:hypothetical protein
MHWQGRMRWGSTRAGNHAIHPSPRQEPIFQIYLNRSGEVIADVELNRVAREL